MTDDPRDILRAAGVECLEVKAWYLARAFDSSMNEEALLQAKMTILALARLVAKYKWQRDELLDEYCDVVDGEWGISHWPTDEQPPTLDDWLDDEAAAVKWIGEKVADLDRRWEELHP